MSRLTDPHCQQFIEAMASILVYLAQKVDSGLEVKQEELPVPICIQLEQFLEAADG